MIGIYEDNFINYLKDNLGNVKIRSKNIVIPCPFCEYNIDKKHYHLYISLEAPIFNCFHAGCPQKSGNLKTLIKKIEGKDISNKFIDQEILENFKNKRKVFLNEENKNKKIIIPKINIDTFPYKEMYIKKRLKFTNIPSNMIKGLIYDVDQFIEINNIPVDETLFKLRNYLHSNFIGFLTEHQTTIMFRNIDHTATMKFFKLKINNGYFLDYYKLSGYNINSNKIVLAEGIFDIYSEYIFDYLNLKNEIYLYASALSSKYLALIQSIIFHHQLFKPEIIILSDLGIPIEIYKKMKKYNRHIINKLSIYYNKRGKDFNECYVEPVKYII
jgi:hypothetical protein